AEFGIPEYFGLDRLERDFTPGKGILGEVHHTGRALADRLLNVVLADLKAQVHLNGRFRHALSRYAQRRLEFVAVIVSYPGEKRGAGIFAEKPGGTRRPGLQKTAGNSDAERVIARRCRREARRRPIATARSDVLTTCP